MIRRGTRTLVGGEKAGIETFFGGDSADLSDISVTNPVHMYSTHSVNQSVQSPH